MSSTKTAECSQVSSGIKGIGLFFNFAQSIAKSHKSMETFENTANIVLTLEVSAVRLIFLFCRLPIRSKLFLL
jgi:hypothetical protein